MVTTQNWLCGWGLLLLLGACEQRQPTTAAPPTSPYPLERAPPPAYLPGFQGIDPQEYVVAKAERKLGHYLLVPFTDPELSAFTGVFYQPKPDSAWQKVAGFKLSCYGAEPCIDTVNIDRQGAAELVVRSESGCGYGSGGGTTCYTLSIFRCANDVTKVLAVPVKYTDEVFVTFQGDPYEYRSTEQAIRPQRGRIKVGRVKKEGIDCAQSDCENCGPRLKPGTYKLVGDTVISAATPAR